MKKSEHAPRGFLGNGAVRQSEEDGVECQKSRQPDVSHAQPAPGKCRCHADGCQQNDQALGPDWSIALVKKNESLYIKHERMDVRGMAACAMKPGKIAAQ